MIEINVTRRKLKPPVNKKFGKHPNGCNPKLWVAPTLTRSSAIAEGLREALVSRNPANTKHLT